MNNKRGGVGAKILLVLILMIASAIGGAYGYRVLDGKMAVRDAKKDVSAVRVTDYDTEEAATIQGIVDDTNKNLETASTRKEVYEIMTDFNTEVEKIQTKTQKELEQARREAEEARNGGSSGSNNGGGYNSGGNSGSNSGGSYDDYNDGYNAGNSDDNYDTDNGSSGGEAPITNDNGSSGRGSILGGIFGGSGN